MTTDAELLQSYAATHSEPAFAELVQRHVNLVYSAALRQVNGDAHLAQDVAQTVFTDLARKAGSLARGRDASSPLTGWLYTSAYFAAAKMVRGETRRRDREEKFMREQTSETAPELDWEKLRPVLDAAMHELKEADREAILLRYFENQPFIQVGAKLGLNENAARMRVERALEKLRAILGRRGVAATSTLASVISANAVQLAPAGLAVTLTTASIISAGAGTFTLIKILTATELKLAVSALVVAGATTALVVQHQAQEKLRTDNESWTQQIAQLKADNESLSNRFAAVGDFKRLTDEQFNELLKLRGEVGVLRRQTNEIRELRAALASATANELQLTNDSTVEMENSFAESKVNNAKQFVLAMTLFANENQNQSPTNLNQMMSYFGNEDWARNNLNQFEIIYRGSLTNIATPSSIIVIRETQPWPYGGKWAKVYGFADGHSEIQTMESGNFSVFEKQHMVYPQPNQ